MDVVALNSLISKLGLPDAFSQQPEMQVFTFDLAALNERMARTYVDVLNALNDYAFQGNQGFFIQSVDSHFGFKIIETGFLPPVIALRDGFKPFYKIFGVAEQRVVDDLFQPTMLDLSYFYSILTRPRAERLALQLNREIALPGERFEPEFKRHSCKFELSPYGRIVKVSRN